LNRLQFEWAVERTVAGLPSIFRSRIDNVVFQVEEWPDRDTLEEVGISDWRDLLGFYRGCPLPERMHDFAGQLPDVIIIYRAAILNHVAETGEPLRRVLRETILHELAHYFGFSEDQMDEVEAHWERHHRHQGENEIP